MWGCTTGYISVDSHGNKPDVDGIYAWNEDYSIANRLDGGNYALACCTDWSTWRIIVDVNNPCNALISINEDNSGCVQEALFGSMTGYYYHDDGGWNKVENPEPPLITCTNLSTFRSFF